MPLQPKLDLGLALLRRARWGGHLRSSWLTAYEGYGEVPDFRDALDADGYWYVQEVPHHPGVRRAEEAARWLVQNGYEPHPACAEEYAA